MKVSETTIILIVVGVMIMMFLLSSCNLTCGRPLSEMFRVKSTGMGWPGQGYGFTPGGKHALEYKDLESKRPHFGMLSDGDGSNLVQSPTKGLGPNIERHPPIILTRKCHHQSDCDEGKQCLGKRCVPATWETYKPNEEKMCMSCMSTDEIESVGL